MKTYLNTKNRLSDLLRAQQNDRMTKNLKIWIENGASDKGDLEEDTYKILKQFYLKRKDLFYLNKYGIGACKRREEDKILYKNISIVLRQLYQAELLFRSHDQTGHQGVDKGKLGYINGLNGLAWKMPVKNGSLHDCHNNRQRSPG